MSLFALSNFHNRQVQLEYKYGHQSHLKCSTFPSLALRWSSFPYCNPLKYRALFGVQIVYSTFSNHFLTLENTILNLIFLFHSNPLVTSFGRWFHFIIDRQQLYYFKGPQSPGIQSVLKLFGLKTQLDISLNTDIQRFMAGNFLGTIEYLHSIGKIWWILFILLLNW